MKDSLLEVVTKAQGVVNMFDQANTANAIFDLGSRGELSCYAIDDLRKALVAIGQPPILSDPQFIKNRK
jgi:hypothetical protein